MTSSKKPLYVMLVGLAVLVHGACHSPGTSAQKNELLHGRIAQITLVDSEHGVLNGVFSPKVIYDLYVDVEKSEFKTVKILVIEQTQVFEQRDNELQQVAIDAFRPRSKSEAVSIPAEVASRAAFFARLHREPSLEHWIKKVIAERIDIEEAAFAHAKRDLAAQ